MTSTLEREVDFQVSEAVEYLEKDYYLRDNVKGWAKDDNGRRPFCDGPFQIEEDHLNDSYCDDCEDGDSWLNRELRQVKEDIIWYSQPLMWENK